MRAVIGNSGPKAILLALILPFAACSALAQQKGQYGGRSRVGPNNRLWLQLDN